MDDTEKMRDLAADEKAEAGSATAKEADAALQAAMQGKAMVATQPNYGVTWSFEVL